MKGFHKEKTCDWIRMWDMQHDVLPAETVKLSRRKFSDRFI